MALPAVAGPTDPVVFADQNLEDAVNAALGQSPGDTITEDQAAGIVTLDASNGGITDISGIEHLTGLNSLNLNNNNVTSLSPLSVLTGLGTLSANNNDISDLSVLSNLTNLVALYLTDNDITNVSALSGLTDLQQLNLWNNEITDVSALSGLTDLTFLNLGSNGLADASPLSGLTSLGALQLNRQVIDLPIVPVGSVTANPVTDVAGSPVPVASSDAGFSYDSAAHAWTFTTLGNKSLTWDTPVTIGSATDIQFSGTISQRISFAQAVPEDPEVVQTTCMNGDVVYPQIRLPDTEGITYTIVGDVAPGETVTIEAVPADDDHAIYVDPASDWVDASGDHIYATLQITLDDPDCDTPTPTVIDAPNGDLPVNDPCGPDNASWVLPTGADVPVGFTWKVAADGLLTAEANADHVFADPSGTLDPILREYGYAPDTNEACPASSDTDGDDSDQVETTGHSLPNTGGPSPASGIVAVALMGIGGLLVLTGRTRHQQA